MIPRIGCSIISHYRKGYIESIEKKLAENENGQLTKSVVVDLYHVIHNDERLSIETISIVT